MAIGSDILRNYEERYEQGNMKISEFREQAKIDVEYFLNKQFSDNEEAYLRQEGRECLVNNKLRRNIMLISGFQRMNAMSSVTLPQGEENQDLSDIISEAVQWVYKKKDGYHHISDCFLYGSLISGINFSEIMLDYSQDSENPDISFNRIPYNAAVWDPYFSKPDMSDCSYFIRRMLTSKSAVCGFLPQHESEIKKLKSFSGDGKFNEMAGYTNPTGQELIAYDEYWERDTEKRLVVLDSRTNEFIGLINKEFEEESQRYMAFDPYRKLVRRTIQTVKLNVILNNEFVERVSDPLGINEYPFVPCMGIYVPEHDDFRDRLQSISRVARDPQSEMNKRINKFLDVLDSKIHTGWIFKKKALAEGEDPYKAGNFRNIAIKNDAVIGQDIQQISPQQTDASLFQSIGVFDQNIMDSLGLNDASFGTPQNGNDSGLLTMMRQQSAMVGLQPFFDNLNIFQYHHTRKVIKVMQQNWPDWKWERITGKKVDIRIRDSSFVKFDVNVTEGVMTENQEKMFFIQLVQLNQMGANIPWSILLKYAPMQDRGVLLKEIQQIEQQQAQVQQQQEQLAQQQIQLANAKTISEIKENEADTVRQTGRALADVALSQAHTAESVQKRSNAALDQVKAAIEIQDSKDKKFMQDIAFVTSLTDKYKQDNYDEMLLNKAIVDSSVEKVTGKTSPLLQFQETP